MQHNLLFLFTLSFIFQSTLLKECSVSTRDESSNESYKQIQLSTKLIESSIQRALAYRKSAGTYMNDNLLFYTPDFLIYIFEDLECIHIKEIEDLAYITSDITLLIESNKSKFPNMLNVFVIYYRTNELTPQTFFYLYDEHTRQQIPPSQLQYTTINVKIKTTININQTNVIKQIHNYNNKNNVNIFQINNEVFNDYCAGFYDKETNKDVVLSDRRKYIYKPLCDEDYIMESIEWNDKDNSINKVICKGKMIDIMLSPVREKLVNETGEVFFEDNVKKESAANVFNCGNTAFKSSKIKHNFGFWIMLIFIIVQIVIVIIYFVNCFSNYMEYLDYLDNKIIMNEQQDNNIGIVSNNNKDDIINEDYIDNIKQPSLDNNKPINDNNLINNNSNKSKLESSTPSNPPKKDTHNFINDNSNSSNINNSNTINIDTTLSKRINSETVVPIIRKPKKAKKSKTKKHQQISQNSTTMNCINQLTDHPNLNKKPSSGTIIFESHNNFPSCDLSKNIRRTTLKRQTTNTIQLVLKKPTVTSTPSQRTPFRRSTNHRTSTIILDVKYNEKEFNPHEMNTLPIDQAIKHDNRSFISIYISTLCNKLFILNLCNCSEISEPFLLRLFVFIFDISCLLFFSGLFFNEEYISQRFIYAYNGEKKINYAYVWNEESPKSVYAALVSMVFIIVIHFFIDTRKELSELYKSKNEVGYEEKVVMILKKIKNKHIIVVIIELLLMILFWYYCTCFCSVYQKTQLALFETTVNSIIFCVIFSLFIYLILTIIRVVSLKCKNNCLYCFSSLFL